MDQAISIRLHDVLSNRTLYDSAVQSRKTEGEEQRVKASRIPARQDLPIQLRTKANLWDLTKQIGDTLVTH